MLVSTGIGEFGGRWVRCVGRLGLYLGGSGVGAGENWLSVS